MKNYKMLIALAGGPDAEKVALAGLLFGKPLHAEIALVSIVRPTSDVSDDGSTPAEISEELRISYEKSLEALIKKIFNDYSVKIFVKKGKPYSMILKTAEDWGADVIVMGIHIQMENSGYTNTNDFEEIVKQVKIPLILVPAE
jgi:nucleotide-binding universal stress UspA family protein